MTTEPRRISFSVKCVVAYTSGCALLGYTFLAVGILVSCLIGDAMMRGDPGAKNGATVFLFPIIGMALILWDRKRVRGKLNVFRSGSVTTGTFFKKKTRVGQSSSGGTSRTYEYEYKFDSEEKADQIATIEAWRNIAPPETATILYDPTGFASSCILDLEPGGMRLQESTVKGSAPLAAVLLLLPASALAAAVFGAVYFLAPGLLQ